MQINWSLFDMESGPLQIFVSQNLEVDGKPAILTFPQEYKPTVHPKSKLIQPKLRLVSLVCKGPIPAPLLKKMLLITVEEVQPNSLLFVNQAAAEGLMTTVLTTVFFDVKTDGNSDTKLRLTDNSGIPLRRDVPLSRLTINFRSYPKDYNIAGTKLDCIFHFQIRWLVITTWF